MGKKVDAVVFTGMNKVELGKVELAKMAPDEITKALPFEAAGKLPFDPARVSHWTGTRGTLRASFALLRRVGFRWVAPGDKGVAVPDAAAAPTATRAVR